MTEVEKKDGEKIIVDREEAEAMKRRGDIKINKEESEALSRKDIWGD